MISYDIMIALYYHTHTHCYLNLKLDSFKSLYKKNKNTKRQ